MVIEDETADVAENDDTDGDVEYINIGVIEEVPQQEPLKSSHEEMMRNLEWSLNHIS